MALGRVVVALLAVSAVVRPGADTAAQAASHSVGATLGKGTVDTYVTRHRGRGSGGTGSARAQKPAPPRLQYLQLPDCPGITPAAEALDHCAESWIGCPAGEQRLTVYEAPLGTPLRSGGWTSTGTACRDPATAHIGEVVIPRLTGSELRRLPLPAGTSTVEPDTGYALVNLPTNVYSTSPQPTVLHTTAAGLRVTIRIHPTEYEWDFGDGSTVGPTADPGGPYPNLTNAHTYTAPGRYAIVMRTWYRGEFSVNDGAFQPITGEGEVTSPPLPIEVLTGEGRLTAGDG